ncbi:hypothetical protein ES703_84898 [subsurface metagenome]
MNMKVLIDVEASQIPVSELATELVKRGWHVFPTWPPEEIDDVMAFEVLVRCGVPPELLKPVKRWLNGNMSLAELREVIAALG